MVNANMTENERAAWEMTRENKAAGDPTDATLMYKNTLAQLEQDNMPSQNAPMQVAGINPVPTPLAVSPSMDMGQVYRDTENDGRIEYGKFLERDKMQDALAAKKVAANGQAQGGLLSDIGDGLSGAYDGAKGMLSGLRTGANKLFNDPARMALLQGGLTAMNPNSYYDQQGFYSPMEGLSKAMGQAGKTFQSTGLPRKLGFKEEEQIKHKNKMSQLQERSRLGLGRGGGEYRKLMAEYFGMEKGDPRRLHIKNRIDFLVTRDKPAAMQEWEMVKDLGEDDLRKYYMMKRASQKINLGGSEAIVDPVDPTQLVAEFPKTPKPEQMPPFKEEQARATARGRVEGEASSKAMIDLPSAERNKTNMLREIDEIINHPDLSNSLGMFDQYINIEGYNADINARITQLTGKNFMNAYAGLKGGGPITDVEGVKAEAAQARLSKAQSLEAFIQALRDLKLIVLETYMGTEEKARLSKNLNLRRSTDKPTEVGVGDIEVKRKRAEELRRKRMENK